jgi:hypothetical protein
MKRIVLVLALVLVAGVLGIMRQGASFGRGQEVTTEIRQTYQLQPGSRIEVSGIRGAVNIETSDRSTGDVDVTITGRNADEMKSSIRLEQTADGLTIRGRTNNGGLLHRWFNGTIDQTVILRLPRDIQLTVNGVNGSAYIGQVDGSVRVNGVNGKLEIAKTSGYTELSSINGRVEVGVSHLDEKGLRISGVNGGVVLRIAEDVNADLNGQGIRGRVKSEAINLTVDDDRSRSSFSGKIGAGGSPINISGINGGVKLLSFDQAQSAAQRAE